MKSATKATKAPERVLFIEFAICGYYEGLKPFAFVTSNDYRYDVDYDSKNEMLVYHQCAYGQCYPVCYLENAEHKYWASENITVVTNSGEPAPTENKIELPSEGIWEYRGGKFYEWPDMVES